MWPVDILHIPLCVHLTTATHTYTHTLTHLSSLPGSALFPHTLMRLYNALNVCERMQVITHMHMNKLLAFSPLVHKWKFGFHSTNCGFGKATANKIIVGHDSNIQNSCLGFTSFSRFGDLENLGRGTFQAAEMFDAMFKFIFRPWLILILD